MLLLPQASITVTTILFPSLLNPRFYNHTWSRSYSLLFHEQAMCIRLTSASLQLLALPSQPWSPFPGGATASWVIVLVTLHPILHTVEWLLQKSLLWESGAISPCQGLSYLLGLHPVFPGSTMFSFCCAQNLSSPRITLHLFPPPQFFFTLLTTTVSSEFVSCQSVCTTQFQWHWRTELNLSSF